MDRADFDHGNAVAAEIAALGRHHLHGLGLGPHRSDRFLLLTCASDEAIAIMCSTGRVNDSVFDRGDYNSDADSEGKRGWMPPVAGGLVARRFGINPPPSISDAAVRSRNCSANKSARSGGAGANTSAGSMIRASWLLPPIPACTRTCATLSARSTNVVQRWMAGQAPSNSKKSRIPVPISARSAAISHQ